MSKETFIETSKVADKPLKVIQIDIRLYTIIYVDQTHAWFLKSLLSGVCGHCPEAINNYLPEMKLY